MNQGTNSLTWDGTDGSAQLPAGPYIIHLKRSNDNADCPTSFDVLATISNTKIDASATPPTISDVQTFVCGSSLAVGWKTNVPTTGAVLYAWHCSSIARIPADDLATFHVVYLPVTEEEMTYDYWVVAKDGAGNTSCSEKKEIAADVGEGYRDISVTPGPGRRV